ncbi:MULTISPECIES: hypothetical protein [Pseudomonas]|uniref:Uncharacterized protein n=1 Tax=Pseudomonas paralactis TaxID=1615673 RepID=A0A0R3ATE1_9PSED|nr:MULTISPECIES: hypothetical protein [Pseudomonas]KRP74084.1 hypothetical protein TX23_06570 [Pseudomonas paralactis]MBJ2217609.1 hypothetical protein [Pseudomonas sp. MF7453]
MKVRAHSKVTMGAGTAIDKNMYYMACTLDSLDRDTPFSRLFFYQDQTAQKWFHHDLNRWRVVSTCLIPETKNSPRQVCALSEEGEVEYYSRDGSRIDRILDAGLSGHGQNFGYMSRIRCIGESIYACGYHGQIYKKDSSSNWKHFDDGILQPHSKIFNQAPNDKHSKNLIAPAPESIDLLDINGSSESEIYTIGDDGFIAYYNGINWSTLPAVTKACLYGMHVMSPQEIWIVGSRGTLLCGNAHTGFKVHHRKNMDCDFYSITNYKNTFYIGASDGIYTIIDGKPIPLDIHNAHKIREIDTIESKNGVLWALAAKELLRFDGAKWDIFEHIDNI